MTASSLDLQQQVQWQYPDRQPRLTWDIKARNYNTAIMTGFYIFGLIVICSMSILFYWIGLDKKNNEWFNWMSVTGSSIFFLFMISFFYPWTHPRKTFVYRFTAEGFEVQGWNDIEKWKAVVIGIGIALVIAILGLVSVFPEAIFGLFIGPPLMGLLYYRLFMSEDYWDIQKDLTKRSFEWNDPEIMGLSIDNKRFIVTLFVVKKGRLFNQILSYKFHVFCPKDRFAEIIDFFKQHLPHLECGEARADVYSHEC